MYEKKKIERKFSFFWEQDKIEGIVDSFQTMEDQIDLSERKSQMVVP